MIEDVKNLPFEESLAELESIIRKMENGEVKLADSVALYERGMQLKKHCEEILQDAKLKIEKIQLEKNSDGTETFKTVPLEIK